MDKRTSKTERLLGVEYVVMAGAKQEKHDFAGRD
jgi:hypothetical protein